MDHQITEEEKAVAKKVREVFKQNNEWFLEVRDYPAMLRQKNQNELADYLTEFEKNYKMKICDIISEVMVDEELGEELKELEKELNEHTP